MKKRVFKVVDKNLFDFKKKIQYLIGKKIKSNYGFHYAETIKEAVSWGYAVCKEDFKNNTERYV